MTDIQQVAEHPEVLVPLNDNKATLLDERIRRMADTAFGNLETVGHLLDEARDGQIHVTLGFKSWPAYVADALGGRMELSSESRKASNDQNLWVRHEVAHVSGHVDGRSVMPMRSSR